MRIQFGLETEYGITREQPGEIDVVAEAIAVVRSTRAPAVRDRWDYRREDPHQDARGFRVTELQQDADEASYFAQDARRSLTFTELKSDLVLRNGARFYNDHTHPEYCTPECSTPLELLQQDWAGDALVMDCAATVSSASANPVRLYKNNTDFFGHSYGCHENYLLPRTLPWRRLAEDTQAFLATRQIFCGAGKFGWETEDEFLQAGFQIAQRSDFFRALEGVETMRNRPLVNTRDEPHANREKYRRFHVIVGDANLSPFATYLKVGTTALVLQALAGGAPAERIPRLADPLAALGGISRDATWKWRVPGADGRMTTAIDVQRRYLELVRSFAAPVDAEWQAVVDAWSEVLDDLERDPLSTADRLDWTAKYRLIEQFRASEKLAPDDPWLRSLDLSYHLLDRGEGLYHGLLESGAFRFPYALKEISAHNLHPPATTRAALRGACIEKFGTLVESAQWDGVVLRVENGRRIEIDLSDLFAPELVARGRTVFANARRAGRLARTAVCKSPLATHSRNHCTNSQRGETSCPKAFANHARPCPLPAPVAGAVRDPRLRKSKSRTPRICSSACARSTRTRRAAIVSARGNEAPVPVRAGQAAPCRRMEPDPPARSRRLSPADRGRGGTRDPTPGMPPAMNGDFLSLLPKRAFAAAAPARRASARARGHDRLRVSLRRRRAHGG